MNLKFIDRTNYFYKPTTWLSRMALIGSLSFVVLTGDFGPIYLQYGLIGFITIIGIIYRKDDIALDRKYFYHLRTSIIPYLTIVDKFEISEIKSIRFKAYDSWFWALKGGKSMSGTDNGIEMTFKDDRTTSLDVIIYKKDMARVIGKVRAIMKKHESERT